MVINTQSTIGYNNKLKKRVSPTMKLVVNGDINNIVKNVGIKHNLGRSKINLPNVGDDVTKVGGQRLTLSKFHILMMLPQTRNKFCSFDNSSRRLSVALV